MFPIYAVMVPTVALTPPPDQAEANWLLRIFFSPLSFSFSILSLTVVHLDIRKQCNVISCPQMAMSLLYAMGPIYNFQAHHGGDSHLYAWLACGLFHTLLKKGCVGWVILTKELIFLLMWRVVVADSSCAVRSSPINTWSEAGQRLLGSWRGGWGMVKQCGNSVADAQ